jgi:DNA-binding NtrC family response regulator/pSer/pThr/pTyr-binding forkhead associated (FHA) protein
VTDGRNARQELVATERDALSDAAPSSTENRPFLVIRVQDDVRTIEVEDGTELLVGRLETAEVSVQHPSVSRRHAVIRAVARELTVEDLGTVNGTRVNNLALFGAARSLAPGDLVSIGPAEIAVAMTAQPRRQRGIVGSGRLERELARSATAGTALVLVRFEGELADITNARLDDALVTDTLGAKEVVALLSVPAADALRARLAAESKTTGSVGWARFPADGETIAALLDHARASTDSEPYEASEGVLAVDPASIRAFQLAKRVAATNVNVLIVGETGVGKEVVADAIHAASPRRDRPFVRLNCGSIPETLLESELFGHERGAFTGAVRRKIGYFEAARDGTLLLDEIGELALPLQAKLLRVIESRRATRLGSTEEIAVDARLVFATHRDLKADVARGRFREDLYYRISTFTIAVPPLRERPSEIMALADLFARRFAASLASGGATNDARKRAITFDATAVTALRNYPWPGNVRELRNAIEHALVMSDGDVITPRDLPEAVVAGPREIVRSAVRDELGAIEHDRIERALAAEGGNRTYAARRLGISRRALLYKISKYGLGPR